MWAPAPTGIAGLDNGRGIIGRVGSSTRLRFGTRFRQPEYLQVLEAIEELASPTLIYLDMSRVKWAQANAMVPLISTVNRLTQAGWEFQLELPRSRFEEEYFEKSGWLAGFQDLPAPPVDGGRSYLPLQRYRNASELNRIFKVLISQLFQETEMAPGVFSALEWSIYEIADNVVTHAGATSGWIQLVTQRDSGLIEVVVSDAGVGIRDSLLPAFPDISSDVDAINRALTKGVTRGLDHGLGNGLAGAERVSQAGRGWLTLHTSAGAVVVREGERKDESRPAHPGTVVALTLPIDCEIDVESALWGPVAPSLENTYLEGDGYGGFHVEFSVARECPVVATRSTARSARVRVKNLLNAFPDEILIMDFTGSGTMASSFADELVGRLSAELGQDQFETRVQFRGLEGLNKSTVAAVVSQRREATGDHG